MIPGLKSSPGFNGAAGSGSVAAMTFVASATSSGASITIPPEAIVGDWAVLLSLSGAIGSTSISSVVPPGWTALANEYAAPADSIRMMVIHRVLAAGGAGGTSVTGMNTAYSRKILLVFRPAVAILSTTASVWNSQVLGGNPTLQTVSASGVATPLIVLAMAGAQSASAPSFSTEAPAMTNVTKAGTAWSIRVGYTIYNSSPSNQSIDTNAATGVNGLQSGYVRFN